MTQNRTAQRILFQTVVATLIVVAPISFNLSTQSAFADSSSCVAEFAKRPCELLTEPLLRTALSEVPTTIEKKAYNGMFSSCTYSWPSEREEVTEIMGRSIKTPEDNKIILMMIEKYKKNAETMFRRSYLPTAEEQELGAERAKEIIQKEFKKNKNLDTQSNKVAKGFAKQLIAPSKYDPVKNVGSMASWQDKSSGSLYVLDGDTKFQITSNISEASTEDRSAAIKLAQAVMASCQ